MHFLSFYVYFVVLSSKLCSVYSISLSERGPYTTTKYQSKLRAEMAKRFNNPEDLMSAFSSWSIMKTQFKSGKVLLPVLNTPRSAYNHRWRALETQRPVKQDNTRKSYVKREENHKPVNKNHYIAHLMDAEQEPTVKTYAFKNVIQKIGKAFVLMPPL